MITAKYTYTSSRIVEFMRQYTPLVEVFSIDEAWLDVTHSLAIFGTAERIAHLLKAQIRESFGITCSIGIAPNKLLAKLASDMQKPDGLTIIPPDRVSEIIEKIPVGDLCGVGKKLQKQLSLYFNIQTCGDLGRADEELLTRKYGIIGKRLKEMGQGIDDSPVIPSEEDEAVKSVGHSMTLRKDIDQRDEILKYLLQLSETVGRRARRYNVRGKTVDLRIRFADFHSSFNKQKSIKNHINLSDDIYRVAVSILDTLDLPQPVRQLGVRLSNLHYEKEQLSLFQEQQRKADAIKAMDMLNDRFGEFKVTFGSLFSTEEKGSHVISPAWRPGGIRNVDVQ